MNTHTEAVMDWHGLLFFGGVLVVYVLVSVVCLSLEFQEWASRR